MKNLNFDLFKLLLVVFISIFLYVYYESSGIGRFQFDSSRTAIIDTKTGQTYMWDIETFYIKKETSPILK